MQFGVTLNTFQALNSRAADMYVSLELAKSLTTWATMVLAASKAAASPSTLGVSRAGRYIGQEATQHGLIGVTVEYSIGSHASHLTAPYHLVETTTNCARWPDPSAITMSSTLD